MSKKTYVLKLNFYRGVTLSECRHSSFYIPESFRGNAADSYLQICESFPKPILFVLFLVSFHYFSRLHIPDYFISIWELWNQLIMSVYRWLYAYPAAWSFIGCFWPELLCHYSTTLGLLRDMFSAFGGKWCVWLRGKLNCIDSVLVQRDKKDEVTHESQVKPSLAGCIISTI